MAEHSSTARSNPNETTPNVVAPLTIELTSFSFKQRPLPEDLFSLENDRHGGGFVFDCRSLPNPGREDAYKSQTGLDRDVIDYLERSPEVLQFSVHINELVTIAVRNFLERRFTLMTIGFGCTGGQHRSVFFCERTAAHLQQTFPGSVITKVCHHNLIQMGMIAPPSSDVVDGGQRREP